MSTVALTARPLPLAAQDLPAMTEPRVPDTSGARHALDIGWWLGAGYDGRIIHVPGIWSALDPTLDADNSRGQLGFSATYAKRGRRVTMSADGETAFHVDSAARRPWAFDDQLTLGLTLSLTRRTGVQVRQSARYVAINPLIGSAGIGSQSTGADDRSDIVPLGIGQPFPIRQALTSVTETEVTHSLSSKSLIRATHAYTYAEGDYRGALEAHTMGARLERRVGAYQQLRLGYKLTEATYDPLNRRFLMTHDLDSGLDYKRQLPFAPRMTLTAGTGASIIDDRERKTFRMLGDAAATYTMTPSWFARVTFSRPVQMVEGMATPLVSTTYSANLIGDLGRRHRMVVLAGYTNGRVSAAYSKNSSVEGYLSAFLWRTQLTRRIALHAEVFNRRTWFGADIAAMSSIPQDAETIGARVFVRYSRPILRN